MARRPSRITPDSPDLPDRLDSGPRDLLSGDVLDGVSLDESVDVESRLCDLHLVECRLVGVDLRARRIHGFMARDVIFDGCDLAGTVFVQGCSLTRVRFDGCRMTGVALAGADLTDVVIHRGTAKLANFRAVRATRLWGVETAFREADFGESTLSDSAFLDCDLAGAEFRAATASGLSLHGSQIEEIRSAAALSAGLQLDADQVVPLGLALVAELGPSITDRPDI